jgi:branched-chain amino acid transport system substrate-binding protein
MNITRRHATASLVSVATLGGLTGCGDNVPDTLKIGVLVAQTGPSGARGLDLLRGAQLAADELNRMPFKVAGKPVNVEIVSFDDKGEIDLAGQGAKQLIDNGAIAVLGPMITPQGATAIPAVAEAGVPHLFTMTSPGIHALGKGNTFRLYANDDLQARAAASFVQDTFKGQRIATIHEASDYGKGLNAAFVDAVSKNGGKVATSFAVDAKANVTTDMASKIKAESVEVVVLFSREPHLKTLYKSLQEVGHTGVTVVGANPVRTKGTASLPVPVRALYVTASAIEAKEFVNGPKFIAEFEGKFKEPPAWGAHYFYDGVLALAGAVRSTESVDRAKLITHLKAREPFTRVNEQMRWNAEGELKYASIAIYQLDRGQWQLQMRSSQW